MNLNELHLVLYVHVCKLISHVIDQVIIEGWISCKEFRRPFSDLKHLPNGACSQFHQLLKASLPLSHGWECL